MTDHKFEPFEKVLVRDHVQQKWKAHFFSHMDGNYFVTGDSLWQYCIPYTPETAHLLGTSQPYEPPKPPQEYEWGQKVEVLQNGEWGKAIFIEPYYSPSFKGAGATVLPCGKLHMLNYTPDRIRPLPDDTVKCGICGKNINERTAVNDVECGPCCPEHYDDTAAH